MAGDANDRASPSSEWSVVEETPPPSSHEEPFSASSFEQVSPPFYVDVRRLDQEELDSFQPTGIDFEEDISEEEDSRDGADGNTEIG